MLSLEDEECQALVSLMDEANESAEDPRVMAQEDVSEYGSEAEDYDRLFMALALQLRPAAQTTMRQDTGGGSR